MKGDGLNQTLKWGKCELTIRPGTVQDDIDAAVIARAVARSFPDGCSGFFDQFGALCVQTESSAGLSWKPELVRTLDSAGQRQGYDEFLKLPKGVWDRWWVLAQAANKIADLTFGPQPLPEGTDPNA